MDQNSNGLITLSILELKHILDTLTLFSSSSADQLLLLDTKALQLIYSTGWMEKASWVPLKMIEIPTRTLPFRFARHVVCTLFGLQLAATITDP